MNVLIHKYKNVTFQSTIKLAEQVISTFFYFFTSFQP